MKTTVASETAEQTTALPWVYFCNILWFSIRGSTVVVAVGRNYLWFNLFEHLTLFSCHKIWWTLYVKNRSKNGNITMLKNTTEYFYQPHPYPLEILFSLCTIEAGTDWSSLSDFYPIIHKPHHSLKISVLYCIMSNLWIGM